jgi:copper homeostasis protein (lipoprotein)
MNFEKPYEPVYVEVEGAKSKSGKEGMGSEYDSTLVVKKVVKITKEIPQDMCKVFKSKALRPKSERKI